MPQFVAWIGFSSGIALMLYGLFPLASKMLPRLQPHWGLMPLHEASREALEAIEGSVMAMMARRHADAPDGALCFMATRLAMDDLPVYGKRIPSTQSQPIKDLLLEHNFAKDATVTQDGTQVITYTDLMVKRSEARALIRRFKEKYSKSP